MKSLSAMGFVMVVCALVGCTPFIFGDPASVQIIEVLIESRDSWHEIDLQAAAQSALVVAALRIIDDVAPRHGFRARAIAPSEKDTLLRSFEYQDERQSISLIARIHKDEPVLTIMFYDFGARRQSQVARAAEEELLTTLRETLGRERVRKTR